MGCKVVILLTAICLLQGAYGQLFDWEAQITYKNDSWSECDHDYGHWIATGTLELSEEHILKFFVPIVNIHAKGHKICSIDLTACPPVELPDNMDHSSCYCEAQQGYVHHLKVVQPAKPDQVKQLVQSSLPLRYNYFKYSKFWSEPVGQIPDFQQEGEGHSWWPHCDLGYPMTVYGKHLSRVQVPDSCDEGNVTWYNPQNKMPMMVSKPGKYFRFCVGNFNETYNYNYSANMAIYDITDFHHKEMAFPAPGKYVCVRSYNGKAGVELKVNYMGAASMDQVEFSYEVKYY